MFLDSLNILAITSELRSEILNSKIQEIVSTSQWEFIFELKKMNSKFLFICLHPAHSAIYLYHPKNLEFLKNLSNQKNIIKSAHSLNKYLQRTKIQDIYQRNFDRIITLRLYKLDELGLKKEYEFVLEFLGAHTNMLLINPENMRIIWLWKKKILSEHKCNIGTKYIYPSLKNKLDPFSFSQYDFNKYINLFSNETSLKNRLMAMFHGMNSTLAQEICLKAKIPENISEFHPNSPYMLKLSNTISQFFSDIKSQPLQPRIYFDGKFPKAVSPINLELYRDLKVHFHPSMSEALCSLHSLISLKESKKTVKKPKSIKEKLLAKLSSLEDPFTLKKNADLLSSSLSKLKGGEKEITIMDESGVSHKIELNPALSPQENLKSYYKRYKKLLTGRESLLSKISLIETTPPSKTQLTDSNYKQTHSPHKSFKPKKFLSPNHFLILVGRSGRENEYLISNLSSSSDLFFHVRNIPGAHVLLKISERKQSPSTQDILFAAGIAAHFSKAKHSSYVPVDYTQVKYLRKSKKAKSGEITISHEKTVFVKPLSPQLQV